MRQTLAPILPMLALLAGCQAAASHAGAPPTVAVPAGRFVIGSAADEREAAYRLDEAAYGHSVTRRQRWYESEHSRGERETGPYRIMTVPVTNALYARFVAATGRPAPDIDEATWQSYGLIHPWSRTRRHAWRDGRPPPSRDDHPVVLVSHGDAVAFAAWLSRETGDVWRLPSEAEWEKAARGVDGRGFPWGNRFDANLCNTGESHAGRPQPLPVDAFETDVSVYGVRGMAGNARDWTATLVTQGSGEAAIESSVIRGGAAELAGNTDFSSMSRCAFRYLIPTFYLNPAISMRLACSPPGGATPEPDSARKKADSGV